MYVLSACSAAVSAAGSRGVPPRDAAGTRRLQVFITFDTRRVTVNLRCDEPLATFAITPVARKMAERIARHHFQPVACSCRAGICRCDAVIRRGRGPRPPLRALPEMVVERVESCRS